MFGGILHRMILWELVKIFVMSLIGITGILLMGGVVAEASQQGLGPAQILAAIPLLIPSTLPYTIPATTLFAACVVYGRLAADNEILAIRAAGINIIKVVKPGLILGLAMSFVTMGMYYRIIPYTHRLLRQLAFNDAEDFLYTLLKKQGFINLSQSPYSMFVKGVKGKKLICPVFKHKNAQGHYDIVAEAREAELHVNVAQKLLQIHMLNCSSTTADGSPAYFDSQVFELALPDVAQAQIRPRDMTWQEILSEKAALTQKIADDEALMATASTDVQDAGGGPKTDMHHHHQNLKERIAFNRNLIVGLNVELLMRPALSLGCFFFILVGCPVGIWFSRSDFLSSFITCFLPIVIVYYPLVLAGTGMAKEGRLNTFLLVGGADMVIGAVGLVLFWRLLRN